MMSSVPASLRSQRWHEQVLARRYRAVRSDPELARASLSSQTSIFLGYVSVQFHSRTAGLSSFERNFSTGGWMVNVCPSLPRMRRASVSLSSPLLYLDIFGLLLLSYHVRAAQVYDR